MSEPLQAPLGELISALYQEFLHELGDPELASLATSASVNDMLAQRPSVPARRFASRALSKLRV